MFRTLLVAALLSLVAGSADARQVSTELTETANVAVGARSGATPDDLGVNRRGSLRIGGGGVRTGEDANATTEPRGTSAWGVAGALALALGLFAAAAKWFSGSKLAAGVVDGGACEVLARVKLEPRASMHVVRVGGRVILIGSAAEGLTALGEIDDPVEAEALAASCRVARPSAFRRTEGVKNAGRDSFRTLFGRAASETAEEPRPAAPEAPEPRDASGAERRLAERLRPAGAVR